MKWNVQPDQFELWVKHGEVIGSKTWAETHVHGSSSGGGGYVSGGSGYVAAPTVSVSSTVLTRNSFFLRSAEGKEAAIDVNGSLPLRDGQRVSVVYLRRKGDALGYILLIANHSSGDVREFGGTFDSVAGRIGLLTTLAGLLVLTYLAMQIGAGLHAYLAGPFSFVAMGVGIWLRLNRFRQFKTTKAQLLAEAHALAAATEAREGPRFERASGRLAGFPAE